MNIIAIFLVCFAVWYILRNVYEDYMSKDSTILRIRSKLISTFPELNFVKIMKGSESTTINKHRIYLCTEYKGVKYDDNMLTYVLLHELAHVKTPEIGHGIAFKLQFETLLKKAEESGLYNPLTYKPQNYCGVNEN